MAQVLYEFFLLLRFVSESSGFLRTLPVFRASLLNDGLGSTSGVDGFSRFHLGITSATDLVKPCGGGSVTNRLDFPQLLRSPVFSEVHT
ncbi:MAG: hypothetical protein F4Y90_03035 [Rhodothermaceae bacterium]|nr:hypothetical protein [Rhodothermaceae bacterium]MYF41663.1 hypothetical protein [Rhodothermaceae bacterium]